MKGGRVFSVPGFVVVSRPKSHASFKRDLDDLAVCIPLKRNCLSVFLVTGTGFENYIISTSILYLTSTTTPINFHHHMSAFFSK